MLRRTLQKLVIKMLLKLILIVVLVLHRKVLILKPQGSTTNAATASNSTSSQGATSSSKANQSSEIQLGLSDVAVWTDENGITHHVDSDGMDRQTTNGSDQITYNDWSGSLPSNAKVVQAH